MYRREERSGGKRSGTKERSCSTDNADKLARSKGGKKVNKKMDELKVVREIKGSFCWC